VSTVLTVVVVVACTDGNANDPIVTTVVTSPPSTSPPKLEPSQQILVTDARRDDGYTVDEIGSGRVRFGPATLILADGSTHHVAEGTVLRGACAIISSPSPDSVEATPCRLLVAVSDDGTESLVALEPVDDQLSFLSGTGRVVGQSIVVEDAVVAVDPSVSRFSCQDVDDLTEFAALGIVGDMVAYLDNDTGRGVVLGCAESD
jgi:hypothetical protein